MSKLGIQTKRTTRYLDWSWNQELFLSKLGTKDPVTGCISWQGFNGPHASLFGVAKNKKPQMIQARRVLFFNENYPNIDQQAVIMRCGNKHCMNQDHMELEGNRRLHIKKAQRVVKGFVETRMGLQKYQNLPEDDINTIKALVHEYSADVKFDHEFMFYAITWTRHSWLLANLKAPRECGYLTVAYRK